MYPLCLGSARRYAFLFVILFVLVITYLKKAYYFCVSVLFPWWKCSFCFLCWNILLSCAVVIWFAIVEDICLLFFSIFCIANISSCLICIGLNPAFRWHICSIIVNHDIFFLECNIGVAYCDFNILAVQNSVKISPAVNQVFFTAWCPYYWLTVTIITNHLMVIYIWIAGWFTGNCGICTSSTWSRCSFVSSSTASMRSWERHCPKIGMDERCCGGDCSCRSHNSCSCTTDLWSGLPDIGPLSTHKSNYYTRWST